jgi:thiamine-phosphate pyrophosphorylase
MPPILYYITDSSRLACAGQERPEKLLERIRAAFAAGVDWVQVREKRMSTRQLCRLVARAAGLPEKGPGRLLVNERLDIALSCGADGVHLPADSLPISVVRGAAPAGFLIGASCHSVAEVEAAAGAGASFAVLGPIFPTPGKGPPLGIEVLREACERVAGQNFPVLALGGITLENAAACLAAGAAGLAAIRLFQSGDVGRVVNETRSLAPGALQ